VCAMIYDAVIALDSVDLRRPLRRVDENGD
jgi:hypothetical protein